ncbi:MAG: peptide MFS transporter [Bacteroidetes bacterium]|jgi:POT family proton-dependent oligopeptide transporter|nr:peptide MFS transporter [Bacteroidota bacterium]HQW96795.1 peptide MFS transporter [Saprospiraceae bacterium]
MSNSKHPAGLKVMFFTEMWERFGFYLILGILQLYLTDAESGGMAMDRRTAADIFGTFIALVYLTPFLGGLIADRKLGYGKSIIIGGILMGLGYLGLAIGTLPTFYASLGLIIIGNGFFKPNISTLVGNLYNDDRYRAQKDSGFNIFYMGINIGAFICNFFAAYLRNSIGWGAAFASAGIGMFIGVIIFVIGRKTYKEADVIKPVQKDDMSIARVFSNIILPSLIAGIVGWYIPGTLLGSDSTDAFLFACIPVLYFFYMLYSKSNEEDKKPVGALLAIFLVSVMFWAVFKQNGTALTTWAQYYTDREVPAAIEKPAEAIYLVEKIKNETGEVVKYDQDFRVVKENGEVVNEMGKDVYLRNLQADKMPPEGETLYVFNTELFQSVNPFWVIFLTPVLVGLWGFLRSKRKEPSTPYKLLLGLLITALSCLVMYLAAAVTDIQISKASAWWLISTYGVITVGELCLSPMGLSLVSKLSPPRLTALLMGGWFLSTSIGNKLSGVLAGMWDLFDNKANFFLMNFGLVMIAFVVLFLMVKRIRKVMQERGIN